MSVIRRFLSVALFPLILGLVSATACSVAVGPSLGLFLAGVVLVSFMVPPICMAEAKTLNRLLGVGVFVSGIIIVWLIAAIRSNTAVGVASAADVRVPAWELWSGNGVWSSEWALASLILSAYAIALTGLSAGFRLARCSAIVSAALTVLIALIWLTWPIWASRTWDGQNSEAGVARLILLHPGMAINAQVSKLGAWTGQSVAYHLTDLQQNVMYSLPHNYWPCVLFNFIIGGALLGLSWWLEGRGVAVKTCPSIVQIDPSATKNIPA